VTTQLRLEDKYNLSVGDAFVTGVQALVQLLVAQHRRDRSDGASAGALVTGYQGSPLGVLDMELARNPDVLALYGIVHQPAVNEELAATALLGSQLVGQVATARFDRVVGMWYGKAPGLDRAADAIRHANHIGCPPTGGVLAVVGDDPGAKSSTLPSASETTLAALQLPTLYPADPGEVVELGLHGYTMSRLSGLWVGCKVATSVADGSQSVSLSPRAPHVPVAVDIDGRPYIHTPSATLAGKSTLDLERSRFYARTDIARRYITANAVNRIVLGGTGDRIGIVSAGKTWLDVRQALVIMGLDDAELARHGIRLIKLGALYPLDREGMRQFTDGLQTVIVVEEKGPFIETQIRDLLYQDASRPAVVGKVDGAGHELFAANGELSPDQIADALIRPLTAHHPIEPVTRWQEERARHRPPLRLPLAVRTPYFCSGCPHNRSVKVPEGSLVGGGIGCHGMAVLMKPEQVGTLLGLTQMGGEGAQWVGMAPFSTEEHIFQNLGDGTFFHSGSLAVRAAVSSGVNITYKILYNSAVAMTGGQDVKGARPIPDLARLLLAEGVGRVIVTSEDPSRLRGADLPRGVEVWHRDRLIEAQEVLAALPGVTVLVHDQECAAEKRRKRKRGTLTDPAQRIFVNERVCEACGDCGVKSNCLSVQTVDTEFGPKTHIHQPSCNKDYTCVDGDCPSFISVVPGTGRRWNRRPEPREPHALAAGDFPDVTLAPSTGWTVRFLGVGGTGVVTASQILGTAALAVGLSVRGLDQTGLAQKGGPVVSDLVMGTDAVERGNKLGDGECDLYLGCDLVVAANPAYLAVADPGRTTSIVSTARVPTGDMVGDPRAVLPEIERFVGAIAERSDADHSVFVDAHRICEALFGGTEFVNVFLLGAAFQSGRLPVSAEAVEEAVILNGAAVEKNIQAFRRGRQQISDPAALDRACHAAASGTNPATAPPTKAAEDLCRRAGLPGEGPLGQLARHRVADLIQYQSERYAGDYAAFVGRVHRAERDVVPGHDELSIAVARYLYKLMAYKDEYEVARLTLDPAVAESVHREFGPDARYAVLLHPPVLRAMGVKRKIRLERSAGPSFRLLRSLRKLRGTPFDPFGRTRVRKTERSLIEEYRDLIERALTALDASTHECVVALACLPDGIRGYEEIKLRSVEEFRRQAAALRDRLAALDRSVPA
jgi:indolepyruvate ferredoxin oxidoreductase